MDENKENILMKAFILKCASHVKYCYYARKAKMENFYTVADHLDRFAENELNHAFAFLNKMGFDETTEVNLTDCVDGEKRDMESLSKMMGEYAECSELFASALKVDSIHQKTAEQLLDSMQSPDAYKLKKCAFCGRKDKSGRIEECMFCGYNRFI